jgi:pimeloyl-ACP methyl ester carboxylesterase
MTGTASVGPPALEVRTSAGPIRCHEAGQGPTLLFVHGLFANGALWRKVVPLLSDRFHCVVPDWPLGAHSMPMAPDAERLRSFERPVLLAWSPEDRVFPLRHAERLRSDLPHANLELIPDSYTFAPEDQPRRLAELVAAFASKI